MAPQQSQPQTKREIVSSESEALILVDSSDQRIGVLDKSACHDGRGVLHRAFSLFVFNDAQELLLQQRAADKRLWPLYWSNTCCSHPREGESMQEASQRRLEQEVGIRTELEFLYKFEYRAAYQNVGSEHELCSVFVGHCTEQPVINTTEINAWRWLGRAELDRELDTQADCFTPWFKMEWQRLQTDFAERLYFNR